MHTVCHIITKLELGGAQEVALYIVGHLDPARFRTVLMTGPGGMLTEEAQSLPGVKLVILPSLVRAIHPFRDLWAVVSLASQLRKVKPAIVHTHSSKAGIVGRWAAWLARVPVIMHTIHGYGITPRQPAWLRAVLIGMERLTGLITTHWVAVSQADIEAGLGWGLFDRGHVSLIRPGIDFGPFQGFVSASDRACVRAELGAEPAHALIGMVACLKPQKAPLDFVRVAEQVCARLPSARFVLVGDGDLRAPVERLIRETRLGDRIRLVGWRRDIPAVMRALDVLLLTSHWEGLARVLLEARASGLPVVATNVGGASEVITEERHGWLCPPGNVDAEADRLCRLLTHADRQETGTRAISELPKEFDIRQMVRQHEELYGKLLALAAC